MIMFKRQCRHCSFEYEYDHEKAANLITFCPNCHSYDHLECEYGFGPVVPCTIYHGSKKIGMVSYDTEDPHKYRIDSDTLCLHKVLEKRYLDALLEATDLISDLLAKGEQQ